MSDVDHIRVEDIAAAVPDGALLGIPADYSGAPMAVTRALIARGARDLRLYCLPQTTMQGDMLIGAGLRRRGRGRRRDDGRVRAGALLQPRASKAAAIAMRDSTCPALHTQLQAVEKGVPFMPLRGLIGSDIARFRPDWRTIQNPFSDEPDEIVLLPATPLDVTVFHAPYADRHGNVFIGRRRELATLVHASREVFVTVEKIVDTDLFETEATAAGALPAFYVSALAVAENGAWPVGLTDIYPPDARGAAPLCPAWRGPRRASPNTWPGWASPRGIAA